MRRVLPTLVVCLVVLAACGNSTPTDSSTAPTAPPATDETTASPSTTAAATSSTGQSIAPSSTAAPATTATSAAPSTARPEVIVAADGATLVRADGSSTRVIEGPVAVAMGDGAGGLLFQQARGRFDPVDLPTVVWWAPAGSSAAQELLVPSDGQSIELHDVAALDGSRSIFYTRQEGTTADDIRQTLRRFDQASGTVVELATVGAFESYSGNISVGGELVATNWSGEAYAGFEFFDLTGAIVQPPTAGDPFDVYFDCAICPANATLSPDGGTLFYSSSMLSEGVVTAESIVAYDMAQTTVLNTYEIPPEVWIHSLDAVDGFVLVNQWNGDGLAVGPPLVIDLRSGDVTELDVVGVGRFIAGETDVDLVQNPAG